MSMPPKDLWRSSERPRPEAHRRIDEARGEAFRAIVAHLSSDDLAFEQLRRKMMDRFWPKSNSSVWYIDRCCCQPGPWLLCNILKELVAVCSVPSDCACLCIVTALLILSIQCADSEKRKQLFIDEQTPCSFVAYRRKNDVCDILTTWTCSPCPWSSLRECMCRTLALFFSGC